MHFVIHVHGSFPSAVRELRIRAVFFLPHHLYTAVRLIERKSSKKK